MATRSIYGVLNQDGTVTSANCSHDGYPSSVGKDLFNHYNTEDKIRELIAKGEASSIDSTLEKSEFYAERDEHEPWVITHQTEVDFWEYDMTFREYHYLFKPAENKWYVRSYSKVPVLLTQEIIDKD